MRILTLLLLMYLSSCTIKSKPTIDNSLFEEDGFECAWNSSQTYCLCQKSVTVKGKNAPNKAISYFVSDTNKVKVKEGTLDSGSVVWLDDKSLVISMVPGIMKDGQTRDDYKRVYDIKSKEITPYKKYKSNNY